MGALIIQQWAYTPAGYYTKFNGIFMSYWESLHHLFFYTKMQEKKCISRLNNFHTLMLCEN